MAYKKIYEVMLASVLILGSTAAFLPDAYAQDTRFYVGAADLAHANIRVSNSSLLAAGLTSPTTTKDRSETGWKVFAGYQFNQYLAVEGGYAVIGDFDFTSVTPAGTVRITSMEPTAWNLDAVGTLPLPYNLSLYARAGIVRSETEVSVTGTGAAVVPRSSFKDKDWGYHAGVGVAFDFHRNVGVRIEWERYRVADGIGGKGDVDLLSWGFRIKF